MSKGASRLKLKAYEKFGNGTASSPLSGGLYTLQMNPEQINVGFDLNKTVEDDDEPASAAGMPVSDKNKVYSRQKISLEFMVDNSGAIPNTPDGLSSESAGKSIKDSIDLLKKVTIKPTRASHRPPFVELEWGTLHLIGKINDFSVKYTLFNSAGDPIRAIVNLSLIEEVDEKVISREFQSPDITRIITVKDGDVLSSLCESFYDDSKYYLKVAAFNNLPSFRKLKIGSKLEFPPLEK
ncbi:CIS tube protein [Belliella aquatica]|uniref:Contractile injection system tube protein N-terminal domain-containing protein n=1 Tax=Belliella aquatica TaxID=1323734 RepID=A0ABQ1MEI2_9BACT|nr:hypothetical protein [Belliella aquatica]MCH7406313.1 hypothetical protein [Belliella aquatica]GGC37796.1 hypothetical protein GCM10010993_15850 [Belliella aquatica]